MKYILKKSAFDDLNEYSLEEECILINGVIEVKYKDIKSIRLYYNPTRVNPNMYETIIKTSNKKYILKNMHYISFGNFEEKSREYSRFIKELHNKVADFDIEFSSGVSKTSYFSQLALVAFTLYILLKALFAFGLMNELIFIKLLFFSFLLYLGYKYFRKNYPKKYTPLDIPINSLPKEDEPKDLESSQ